MKITIQFLENFAKLADKAEELGFELGKTNQTIEQLFTQMRQHIFDNTSDENFEECWTHGGDESSMSCATPAGDVIYVTGEFSYDNETEMHSHKHIDLDGTALKIVWVAPGKVDDNFKNLVKDTEPKKYIATYNMIEVKDQVITKSDYHPDFVYQANALGGTWNSEDKTWEFPVEMKSQVLQELQQCYGIDGEELTTVDITITRNSCKGKELWMYGRRLAIRYERDSSVVLGPNVTILEGKFYGSGGSRKNPSVMCNADPVTLRVLRVPVSLVERQKELTPQFFEV